MLECCTQILESKLNHIVSMIRTNFFHCKIIQMLIWGRMMYWNFRIKVKLCAQILYLNYIFSLIQVNSDCPTSFSCIGNRCKDPCSGDGSCGPNAQCQVVDQRAQCSCFDGFMPNPTAVVGCVREPTSCVTNKQCPNGHQVRKLGRFVAEKRIQMKVLVC